MTTPLCVNWFKHRTSLDILAALHSLWAGGAQGIVCRHDHEREHHLADDVEDGVRHHLHTTAATHHYTHHYTSARPCKSKRHQIATLPHNVHGTRCQPRMSVPKTRKVACQRAKLNNKSGVPSSSTRARALLLPNDPHLPHSRRSQVLSHLQQNLMCARARLR